MQKLRFALTLPLPYLQLVNLQKSSSEHFHIIDQLLYFLTESLNRDITFRKGKELKLI